MRAKYFNSFFKKNSFTNVSNDEYDDDVNMTMILVWFSEKPGRACLPAALFWISNEKPKPKLTHSLQSSVIMMAMMTSNNHLVNTNMDLAKRYQCLSRFVPIPDKSKCLGKSVCQVQSAVLCEIVPILNGALCNIILSLCCQCLPIPDKSKCVSKSVCQTTLEAQAWRSL